VEKRTPSEWLSDIKLGLRYRSANEREQRWQRNYRYFKGQYDAGLIPVNIVFGICRTMIPQIYFKAPTVLVRPRPGNPQEYPRRMMASKTLQAADKYLIKQMGLKKTLKLATLDSLLYNVGVIKIGYHSVFSEFEVGPPAETQEVLRALAEITGETPSPPEAMTDKEYDKYIQYSYHDLIKPNMPWALRISPRDFVVPVGTKNIEEAPWCAFRFVKRLDEMKMSPVYKNKDEMKANASLRFEEGSGIDSPSEWHNQVSGPMMDDYVEAWEIWDKRDERIRVVSDGASKFLRDEEHGLEITGLPVEIVQFNPDGDDFWGVSHVDAIAPQVLEYTETRTQEAWHRKISNLKMLIDKSMLPPEEIAKIEAGTIGNIVLVNGDPTKAVHAFTSQMSRDIFKNAEDIFADLKVIIGYNRNQGGEFEQSRRTAEEIKTVRGHNQIRDDELRDILADVLADMFSKKIHPLLFQNWSTDRFVEVTSVGGAAVAPGQPAQNSEWKPFDGASIRGDYDVEVIPDSTLPLNKEQEKVEALALFQAFKNDPFIRQDVLRKNTIDKFESVRAEDLLKTQQEMQQEMQQKMQMEMAMAQAKTQVAGTPQQSNPQQLVKGNGGKPPDGPPQGVLQRPPVNPQQQRPLQQRPMQQGPPPQQMPQGVVQRPPMPQQGVPQRTPQGPIIKRPM
jgi:hypothetical protein